MRNRSQNFGLLVELPYWVENSYRVRLPALLAATYIIYLSIYFVGLPEWLVLLILPPYIIATIATYNRLIENRKSGWWILLMIMHIGIEPRLFGLSVLGTIVNLVPVVIAWQYVQEPEEEIN